MAKKKSAQGNINEAFVKAVNILNDSTPRKINYRVVNVEKTIVGNVGERTVAVGAYGRQAVAIDGSTTDHHRETYTTQDAKAVAAWLNSRGVLYTNQGEHLYEEPSRDAS